MEDLIKQAFAHVDVIGPHVQEGHYDLMGPDGEIILPIIWDTTIQPGWQITMRMWPMDKHPLQSGQAGMPPGLPDMRGMPPEQRHRIIELMRMRHAQAGGAGGGHHGHSAGGHSGRGMPMRPPPGAVPVGGMPPPPPGMQYSAFRPGPGMDAGRGMPAGVNIVDARPERKKSEGKAAKKTISFFAGSKKPTKKSSSSKKYVQAWY